MCFSHARANILLKKTLTRHGMGGAWLSCHKVESHVGSLFELLVFTRKAVPYVAGTMFEYYPYSQLLPIESQC